MTLKKTNQLWNRSMIVGVNSVATSVCKKAIKLLRPNK